MTEEDKKKIIEGMITSTKQQILMHELDIEFYGSNSIVNPDFKAILMMRQKQLKHLTAYLKFLESKL